MRGDLQELWSPGNLLVSGMLAVMSSQVECKCAACGTRFLAWKSRVNLGQGKYCSRACSDKRDRGTVSVECEVCQKLFRAHASLRSAGRSRFCSVDCRGAHQTNVAKAVTPESLAERFWKSVDKNCPEPAHVPGIGACWEWRGSILDSGYGLFYLGPVVPRQMRAHRYAWYLEHGSHAEKFVCHRCDNPKCVRPDHLFEGTHAENMTDCVSKGRMHTASKILDPAKVREIRRRHSEGDRTQAIADDYGVSFACIHMVVTHQSWKSVA